MNGADDYNTFVHIIIERYAMCRHGNSRDFPDDRRNDGLHFGMIQGFGYSIIKNDS